MEDCVRTSPQPPMGGRGSPAPHKGLGRYQHRREHNPSPPRGGGAAQPPIRGWAHTNTGAKTSPQPPTGGGGAARPPIRGRAHNYTGANIAPAPPRGGGAARPPIRGRAHNEQSKRPSRLPVSCWLAGVRRGVGGRGCGPGSCGVCVSVRGRLPARPPLVQ